MEHIASFPLPPVTLVLGGARSGKSTHAEKLATGTLFGAPPRPAVYIATAQAGDVEMATRIMAHRARRGVGWTTIEEPLRLADALESAAVRDRPVLVDCLTLWLSNLMQAGADIDEATDELLHVLAGYGPPVVFVSNEVGLGLVPETPLGRSFRDAQGRLNMRIAQHADRVILMAAGLPLTMKDRPKLVMTTEAYYAMKTHVLVRFGRWREIIDAPPPGDPEIYKVSIPMHHYARGIAYATLKEPVAADRERRHFREAMAHMPADRKFLGNFARNTLGVGEAMLDGEVEYHKGNYEQAYAHLREAVHRDDNLYYTEPWAWMHPPRHALAALLMEQGHHAEAESVYRDDLGLSGRIQRCTQHPDNVWALHGLVECLQRRGETDQLPVLEAKLAAALTKVDVPITSSCMCRTKVYQPKECCA